MESLARGCDAVNLHIHQSIPETLWHYTSFQGFSGIVLSRSIWATGYRFLNDREEFIHARKLARSVADDAPEIGSNRFPAREFLIKGVDLAFNTGLLRDERLEIMIASFSKAADQLSQWRGYSHGSTGVSLGLDLRALRPSKETGSAVVLAPCLYTMDAKRGMLQAVFAHFTALLRARWDETTKRHLAGKLSLAEAQSTFQSGVLHRAINDLAFDLLRVGALLKDESFAEEQEWRLVLPREPLRMPTRYPIQFRALGNCLAPYTAFPLTTPNQEGPIACRRVITGPGSHPSVLIGVDQFLQSQGISIRAQQSQIPYRPS